MQEPTKPPSQQYQKAIDFLEAVRLETQMKGRDGDAHRAAIQAVVTLFNEWIGLTKASEDLKKRVEEMAKQIKSESVVKPD